MLSQTRSHSKIRYFKPGCLELVLNKCEGIRINQSLMGRMLGFGSIVVTTGGVTNKFDFITNPIKFRNEINEQIQ